MGDDALVGRDDLDDIGGQLNVVRLTRPRYAEAYAAVLERAIAMFDDDPVAAGEVFDRAELTTSCGRSTRASAVLRTRWWLPMLPWPACDPNLTRGACARRS